MALHTWPTVTNRNVAQPSRVRLSTAPEAGPDVYDVTPVPGTVVNDGTLINQALFDQMEQYVKEHDIPIHTTTGTGAAYAVSVPVWSNLTQTELDGHILCIIPNVASTTVSPTLNMNGLGAKPIYAPGGSSTSDRGNLPIASYLTANVPVYLIYNKSGDCWITLNAATTPVATNTTVGTVKPDGKTITISSDGTLTSNAKDEIAAQHERDQLEFANALICNKSGALVNVDNAWGVKALKVGVDGKSVQTVGVWGTNLVTNGDFSNGTAGWQTTTASLSAANNELILTIITGSKQDSRIYQLIGAIAGHKYYAHGSIMRTNANTFTPKIGGSDAVYLKAVANTYVTYGIVLTAVDTTSYSVYLADTVAGEVIKFKNLLAIDLTATFGAGNEPTATQMDEYLAAYPNSWFDGSALLTTNGTPNSPSPEYPQEIDVVDSPVVVQATGKNLSGYPYKTFTAPAIKTINGVTFEAKDDGTIVANGTATANADVDLKWGTLVAPVRGLDVNISGCPQGGSGTTYLLRARGSKDNKVFGAETNDYGTGTTISGANFVRTFMRVAAGTTANNLVFKPQIEIGSATTSYEPYTSNQQTITLPPEHNYLASLPDGTHDELVLRADGVAVLTERVGKVVFDGNENVEVNNATVPGSTAFGFYNSVQSVAGSQAISSHFAGVTTGGVVPGTFRVTATAIVPTINNATIGVLDTDTDAVKVAAFKSWLAANPVTVYYKLATPATSYSADNGTTWPTIDPAAGNSAIQLYKGTNNVWCTDALSPTVDLEYVQDTNKVINKLRAATVLPPASATTLGGVKVGSGLSVTADGTLSATSSGSGYVLPPASASTLGGIKVGSNLSITADGVLSATDTKYTLPPATKTILGGVKVGDGINVSDDGTISATAVSYPISVANGGTGANTAATALVNLGITMGTAAAPSTGTAGSIYIQYT